MFTKFVLKMAPKVMANPAIALEMAPWLLAAGAVMAVHDLING